MVDISAMEVEVEVAAPGASPVEDNSKKEECKMYMG